MLRIDTTLTCFEIQRWIDANANQEGFWSGPCNDGIEKAMRDHDAASELGPNQRLKDLFSASGFCWQTYGIYGVMSEAAVFAIVPLLRHHYQKIAKKAPPFRAGS
jgi:hypothetical protein